MAHAVKQAYQDVLFHGRHPVYVLYLQLDPALVDVNAHPTKLEVRFREGRLVHDFLFQALHRSLADQRPADSQAFAVRMETVADAEPRAVEPAQPPGRAVESSSTPLPQQTSLPMSMAEDLGTGHASATTASYPAQAQRHFPPSRPGGSQGSTAQLENYAKLYPPAEENKAIAEQRGGQSSPPLGFALAHIHNIYILAETEQGVILVDAHAAHERVTYERLKQHYHQGSVVTQPLLLPIKLKVSAAEADLAEQQHEFFAGLGFELNRSGPEAIVLRSTPALLAKTDVEQLLRDILADMLNDGFSRKALKNQRYFAHHGLSWFGQGEAQAEHRGNERLAARHGNDQTQRPMQPWPAHLGGVESSGTG